ncbi:hypothetical protein Pelo_17737 [Pelomyxa schiedti]|nr:hypothetical protein Pelo_17737 [Pelomyxa schiedti]
MFEVSPLVLGLVGRDPVATTDGRRARCGCWAPGVEWVDSRRRLMPPPFVLYDSATGGEVSLFPGAVQQQPLGGGPVHAANHAWLVAGGFEGDFLLKEGMLGLSIGRLADKEPGATSVVVRTGYSAATHKVAWLLFSKSAANEVVAVVKSSDTQENYVFVVIDVEREQPKRGRSTTHSGCEEHDDTEFTSVCCCN